MEPTNSENPGVQAAKPPLASAGQNLFKHAVIHFVVAVSAFSLWAAADAWYLLTDLAVANFLSISTAVIAGVVVSTLFHEWFHFAGAKFSGSSYRIPAKIGLFVYDYDYEKNSISQFTVMSLAGQAGSWVAVIGLISLVPMDNSGRWMLAAGALGSAVFGGAIEWPVLLRSRESNNPLGELSKITAAVFNRSLLIGSGSGLFFWYALS